MPDAVLTEDQQSKRMRKRHKAGDERHSYHFRPAEWWRILYKRNRTHYYELKYGMNNSGKLGLFCAKCDNERCGWTDQDMYHVINHGICQRCSTQPLPVVTAADIFDARVAGRVAAISRLEELHTVGMDDSSDSGAANSVQWE